MRLFLRLSLILLSITSFALSGCSDVYDPIADDGDILYEGLFYRGGPQIDPKLATVGVRFSDGMFEGSSSEVNYPAICNGTYKVKGTTISFQNKCMFPANFDWSFILAGDFEYQLKGDSLIMQRSYEGGNFDRYMLKRAR